MMNLSRMVCNKNEASTQIVICIRNLLTGRAEQENVYGTRWSAMDHLMQ